MDHLAVLRKCYTPLDQRPSAVKKISTDHFIPMLDDSLIKHRPTKIVIIPKILASEREEILKTSDANVLQNIVNLSVLGTL